MRCPDTILHKGMYLSFASEFICSGSILYVDCHAHLHLAAIQACGNSHTGSFKDLDMTVLVSGDIKRPAIEAGRLITSLVGQSMGVRGSSGCVRGILLHRDEE